MHMRNGSRGTVVLWCLLFSTIFTTQAQLLWTVGLDDNNWPLTGTGGRGVYAGRDRMGSLLQFLPNRKDQGQQ